MGAALRMHGPLSRGVFAVVVLLSLAVLFAPGSEVPTAPAGVDKIVHAGLFLTLAVSGRWAGLGRGLLAGLLIGYAAVSETVQELSPLDRAGSVEDFLFDVVGVLLGLGLWALVARRIARLH